MPLQFVAFSAQEGMTVPYPYISRAALRFNMERNPCGESIAALKDFHMHCRKCVKFYLYKETFVAILLYAS